MKSIPMTTKIPIERINTILVNKLPDDVPAMVSRNPDDTYTIALNAMYSQERLLAEYLHELRHIEENHFSLKSADVAEKSVRDMLEVGFTLIKDFPVPLQRELAKEYHRQNPPKQSRNILREEDYYPPGAYRQMKKRRWI